MSRTYRKVPKGASYWRHRGNEDFVKKMERGLVTYGIRDPDDSWSEVSKRTNWAKRREGRKRRLKGLKGIREQMGDLDL